MECIEDLLKQIRSSLTETRSALLDWKASYLALSSIANGLDFQAKAQNNPIISGFINKYKNHIDAYLQKTKDDIEQAEMIMKDEWKMLESAEQGSGSNTVIDCWCESKTKLVCDDMTEDLSKIIQGLQDCFLMDRAVDKKETNHEDN